MYWITQEHTWPAFLPNLVSKREEEKNYLHLKLYGNFKGSMVFSLQDGKPLKCNKHKDKKKPNNNIQIKI